MSSPDPQALYPIPGFVSTVYLRPLLETKPGIGNIAVGDFSYYSDFDDPLPFFERNLRYNFGFSGARLTIGRYCALAHGTSFIMPDANHAMTGVTTYPFPVFGGAWAERMRIEEMPFPNKGDTVVGHDVWFGYEALVMPGVRIGHGAIVGARSVVTRDVPDYAIVAGNPARMIRRRFDQATIARLLELAWWDWEPARVAEAIPHLVRGEIDRLDAIAARREV